MRTAYEEASRIATDASATWIVFHLVYNDLLRAWDGPLRYMAPVAVLNETGS